MKKKIAVIIPTKNEEKGIGKVIRSLPKSLVSEIIVVDGHSQDGTVEIATSNGFKNVSVVNCPGKGKGADFQIFLKKKLDSDIYVMLDGDGTYNGKELKNMVAPILNGNADIVMGYRLNGDSGKRIEKDSMGSVNIFGNKCLSLAAKLFYRRWDLHDLCTGYWAFSREFLKDAKIRANGFDLEANLFTEAAKKKFRIKQVPITYSMRIGKEKLKKIDGFKILYRILRERLPR